MKQIKQTIRIFVRFNRINVENVHSSHHYNCSIRATHCKLIALIEYLIVLLEYLIVLLEYKSWLKYHIAGF